MFIVGIAGMNCRTDTSPSVTGLPAVSLTVTSNMLSPVVETLCLLTEVMTLEPGDVIAMGTPSGVGYARNPPVFMKAGDRIEIEIEKIGVLANTIVDED